MPFVSVQSAVPISPLQDDTLQREIGRLITIIPGKSIDNCMTRIEGDCHMFMGGGPAKAVFCEVRMFGPAPAEAKAELGRRLEALFQKELGAEKVYINFQEYAEWYSLGAYKTV